MIYDYIKSYYLPVIIYYIYVTVYGGSCILADILIRVYTHHAHINYNYLDTNRQRQRIRNSCSAKTPRYCGSFPLDHELRSCSTTHILSTSAQFSHKDLLYFEFPGEQMSFAVFVSNSGVLGSTQTTTSDSIKKRGEPPRLSSFLCCKISY